MKHDPEFPWRPLARPLSAKERVAIAAKARALLAWQETLDSWPRPSKTKFPDATPFVSLFTRARIRGCFGSAEGPPEERLARAFLRALEDVRLGAIGAADRGAVSAKVSYVIRAERIEAASAPKSIEVGSHGVALRIAGHAPAIFLPDVARMEAMGPGEMLARLARKAGAGAEDWTRAVLWRFETEEVVVRAGESARVRRSRKPASNLELAARWLRGLIDDDGRVTFAIDGRTGARHPTGKMAIGRGAVAIAALVAQGGHEDILENARARLINDIGGLPSWPQDQAPVGGTIALACLAGAQLEHELAEHARASEGALARVPWHAGQVISVLGTDASPRLWSACVADLETHPWAPWTCLAAVKRGDRRVAARTASALAASIRRTAPHRGGANVTDVPQIALTAIAVEAMVAADKLRRTAELTEAISVARGFLAASQLLADRLPPWMDEATVLGAFPASPVASLLRCDITGHALLALADHG